MKTKNEICVHIRNEKELQQAREILERNGEKIDYNLFELTSIELNYLKFHYKNKKWYLASRRFTIEIPLSELESVLRRESESKKQSSIEWIKSEIKKIPFNDPSVSDFYEDVLKVLEQAKQMHREEIENAINTGHGISTNVNINFDFYYNKNFEQ